MGKSETPGVVAEHEAIEAFQQRGDRQALGRLLAAHEGYIKACAWQFRRSKLAQEDLVQEGMLGFIEAVKAFSTSKYPGVPLLAFAKHHVRQRMAEQVLANSFPISVAPVKRLRKIFFRQADAEDSRAKAELAALARSEPFNVQMHDFSQEMEPSHYLEGVNKRNGIQSAIEILREVLDPREIAILFDMLGGEEMISYAELGRRHQVTPPTAKRHFAAALDRARTCMASVKGHEQLRELLRGDVCAV